MSRRYVPVPGLLALLVLAGCGDENATGVGDDLFPVEPLTLQITLPWSEFAQSMQVFGGFGRASEVPSLILAHEYQGVLDARVLSRFQRYPRTIVARDPQGDTLRADSLYSYSGGRLVVRIDTVSVDPFDVEVRRPPPGWVFPGVSWTAKVDTLNTSLPWEEDGAGPAPLLATGVWDPEDGDSLVVELDSATVDALADTAFLEPGIRLDASVPDTWVRVRGLALEVDVVPSFDPDTTVTFTVGPRDLSFIYHPQPDPPDDNSIRVAGAPSWRTVLRFSLPEQIDGPPAVCALVGCPFELDPDRLNAATLVLTSRAAPLGFQPRDTLRLDVRPVLAPERLPKAPLGSSPSGGVGVPVAPAAFGPEPGEEVAMPITGFVRALLRGETSGGEEPPAVLALLSPPEPGTIALATFVGPGLPGEPVLRLVLTTSDTVRIR